VGWKDKDYAALDRVLSDDYKAINLREIVSTKAKCAQVVVIHSAKSNDLSRGATEGTSASEVRIFPALALDGRTSPYVPTIVDHLSDYWEVSFDTVPCSFQGGGNNMMRVHPLQTESM
jgi:hypothetical protein